MEIGSISPGRNMKKKKKISAKYTKEFFCHGVVAIMTALVKIHHIHTCLCTHKEQSTMVSIIQRTETDEPHTGIEV